MDSKLYVAKTLKERANIHKAKLESEGRYCNGKYYSKGGTARILGYWDGNTFIAPIDGHPVVVPPIEVDECRLNKFSDLWENMIRVHFPTRYVWGAMWGHDDLVSLCRIEAFKALSETFDPNKMRSRVFLCKTEESRIKRFEEEKELCRDFNKILSIAERGWVKERLRNFLWRSQYNYHPQQLGGIAQSMTPLAEDKVTNKEMRFNLFYETKLHSPEAIQKTEELLFVMDQLGPKEAANLFFSMECCDRDGVIEIIEARRDYSLERAMQERDLFEAMTKTDNYQFISESP
jgi:hypothetical protein